MDIRCTERRRWAVLAATVPLCVLVLAAQIEALVGVSIALMLLAIGLTGSISVTLVGTVILLAAITGFPGGHSAEPILIAAPSTIALAILRHRLDRNEQRALHIKTAFETREKRLLHDLRTPLNGINGSLELLDRRNLDARGKKYVDLGLRSASQMAGLIDANCSDIRVSEPTVSGERQCLGEAIPN